MLRNVLISLAMALCLSATSFAQEPDAAEPTGGEVFGGKLTWLLPQTPGETACARVRGEALSGLLAADDNWTLTCAGKEIPARLHLPRPLPTAERFNLELRWQKETAAGELQALLDRGETADEIDRLKLYFAAVDVRCGVRIEYSDDRETFTTPVRMQAVSQRLATGVLRLTTLTIAPGESRYLRLTLPGVANARLDRAEAWAEPPVQWRMYEVEVGLGPMREGTVPGEHLWPIMLPDDGLPLAKLKIIADAPGSLRRMRVVRTGPDGIPRENVTELVWADRVQVKSGDTRLTRSEKWAFLAGTTSGSDGWAVVIDDGDDDALQVTRIQAYAADVELSFSTPETAADVELWLEAPGIQRLDVAPGDTSAGRIIGEVTALNLTRAPGTATQLLSGHHWEAAFENIWDSWHRPVIWCALCLTALFLGLVLLSRRDPEGLAD